MQQQQQLTKKQKFTIEVRPKLETIVNYNNYDQLDQIHSNHQHNNDNDKVVNASNPNDEMILSHTG